MQSRYPTDRRLRKELDLRSLYLFPISIVVAHFNNTHKRKHSSADRFVQIKERFATNVYRRKTNTWQHLGLEQGDYSFLQPHERVHILTRRGYLERQILESFSPEFV